MRVSQFSGFGLLYFVRGSVAGAVQLRAQPPFNDSSYHWSPKTIISFEGSPEFNNATERWDIYMAPTYRVAISPATETDVVTAVLCPTSASHTHSDLPN